MLWDTHISALYIREGGAEIDVQYIAVRRYQSGHGLDAGGFRLADPAAVFPNIYNFYLVLTDQVKDIVFSAYTHRAAGMIENGLAHLILD